MRNQLRPEVLTLLLLAGLPAAASKPLRGSGGTTTASRDLHAATLQASARGLQQANPAPASVLSPGTTTGPGLLPEAPASSTLPPQMVPFADEIRSYLGLADVAGRPVSYKNLEAMLALAYAQAGVPLPASEMIFETLLTCRSQAEHATFCVARAGQPHSILL